MSYAIENYICASEDYCHYNCDYNCSFCSSSFNSVDREAPMQRYQMMSYYLQNKLKKVIKEELEDYITEDMKVEVDLDYRKLTHKPQLNGEDIEGDHNYEHTAIPDNDIDKLF